jgi:N-acetylneuraminic acid mutarotase
VAGGYNGGPLNSSELYDPAAGTWSPTSGSLSTGGRAEHTATLLPSGKVLVAGGWDADNLIVLNSAELYNPASGTWTPTGALLKSRLGHTATLLPSGKVLVAAGLNGAWPSSPTWLASAELYDPAKATWSTTASLTAKRSAHTATLLNTGQVLVAGGVDNNVPLSSAELYRRPAISPIIDLLLLH